MQRLRSCICQEKEIPRPPQGPTPRRGHPPVPPWDSTGLPGPPQGLRAVPPLVHAPGLRPRALPGPPQGLPGPQPGPPVPNNTPNLLSSCRDAAALIVKSRLDLQTCLGDSRRYEREIERLHQKHLFTATLYELRQDDVALARLIQRRRKVGKLLARAVSRGDYELEPGEVREIEVDGKVRAVVSYNLTDTIVRGAVSTVIEEAVAPHALRPALLLPPGSLLARPLGRPGGIHPRAPTGTARPAHPRPLCPQTRRRLLYRHDPGRPRLARLGHGAGGARSGRERGDPARALAARRADDPTGAPRARRRVRLPDPGRADRAARSHACSSTST